MNLKSIFDYRLILICIFYLGLVFYGCGNNSSDKHGHDEHEGHDEHAEHGNHEDHVDHAEHGDHDEHEGHKGQDEHGDEEIKLSDEEIKEFNIIIQKAKPGVLYVQLKCPGEIRMNSDKVAHIIPRFPGVVKKVLKNIGDNVKKGEVVSIIESNESLSAYEIKSLIKGVIVEKHLVLGEALEEGAVIYVVADLSTVWADFTLYQKDLSKVKIGQIVSITSGNSKSKAKGRISYISPVIDEGTRTTFARVVLRNRNNTWRPGLFITGLIKVQSIKTQLLVPMSSLHTVENKPSIFVKTDEGFAVVHVKTGRSNSEFVEILSGLNAGNSYVAEGGFTLKSELAKGSFGHGHNH